MNSLALHHRKVIEDLIAELDAVPPWQNNVRRKAALRAALDATIPQVTVVADHPISEIAATDMSGWSGSCQVTVGRVITGTLVIVAPPNASEEQMVESAKHAQAAHNSPVILLPHNWQVMSSDELRAELDRIESTKVTKTKVAIFVNSEFVRTREFGSSAEAQAYANGVSSGAGEFSGDMCALVWPDDEKEIMGCSPRERDAALRALGVESS